MYMYTISRKWIHPAQPNTTCPVLHHVHNFWKTAYIAHNGMEPTTMYVSRGEIVFMLHNGMELSMWEEVCQYCWPSIVLLVKKCRSVMNSVVERLYAPFSWGTRRHPHGQLPGFARNPSVGCESEYDVICAKVQGFACTSEAHQR